MTKKESEKIARKAQKIIVSYRSKLEGMDLLKADDLLEMIAQAKMIKEKIIKAIKGGDVESVRWFKPICDTITACYDQLPATPTPEGEKTTVEQAMNILFGDE